MLLERRNGLEVSRVYQKLDLVKKQPGFPA